MNHSTYAALVGLRVEAAKITVPQAGIATRRVGVYRCADARRTASANALLPRCARIRKRRTEDSPRLLWGFQFRQPGLQFFGLGSFLAARPRQAANDVEGP